MEIKNQVNKLKKLEEAELEVVLFDNDNVVATSGEDGCTSHGCLFKGTKVAMSDGSVKNIEDICEGDIVLTFDHEAGCYVGKAVLYAYKSETPKCAFTLRFSNGATLSIVGEHDLFEQENRKYVTISEKNAEQFIGRHFYSLNEKSYVELLDVTHETEATDYYELYTENALNMVANGMLNVADDVDCMINIYEFNEDLSINKETLASDIKEYGLFDFSAKYGFTKHEYDAWNMRYINIAVGKALTTMDYLWNQHYEYLNSKGISADCECA